MGHSSYFGIQQYLVIDLGLARGLDYYTGPVFEVYAKGFEDAGSIAGGGRYNDLVELFGGDATPMTGISMGIHRLVTLLEKMGVFEGLELGPEVYVVSTSEVLQPKAIEIAQMLRRAGLSTEMDLLSRGMSRQLEIANRKGVNKVVIVGERELKDGCVSIRDMKTAVQRVVRLERLVEEI